MYIMAKVYKEKPLIKGKLDLGSHVLFASRLYDWLDERNQHDKIDGLEYKKPDIDSKNKYDVSKKVSFLDKLRGLFGL